MKLEALRGRIGPRGLVLVCLAAPLAACTTTPEQRFAQECRGWGFVDGTPAMARCLDHVRPPRGRRPSRPRVRVHPALVPGAPGPAATTATRTRPDMPPDTIPSLWPTRPSRCATAVGLLAWALATGHPALAEEAGGDTEALAKQAQNRIANLISVPFQNNINFGVGERGRTQNVLNFQPVIPFKIGGGWNLITRTITPIIYQPSLFKGVPGVRQEQRVGLRPRRHQPDRVFRDLAAPRSPGRLRPDGDAADRHRGRPRHPEVERRPGGGRGLDAQRSHSIIRPPSNSSLLIISNETRCAAARSVLWPHIVKKMFLEWDLLLARHDQCC